MTLQQIEKELQEELEKLPPIGRPEIRAIKMPMTKDNNNKITTYEDWTILNLQIYWNGNAINWEKMAYISEWGDDHIIITLCEKLEPLQMQVPFKITKEKGLEILKNLLYGE
jgi:hypothetical protein